MAWFQDLSIRGKLLVSFGLLLALTGGVGAYALVQMADIAWHTTDLGEHWMPALQHIGEFDKAVNTLRRKEQAHVLADDEAAMRKRERDIRDTEAELAKLEQEAETIITSEKGRALLAEFTNAADV